MARHFAQTVERRAVADHALNRFSSATSCHKFLAFGQAALRNIGNKSGVRIAALRPADILRQLDDPVADRLVAGAGQRHTHQMNVDESFRHAIGFDNRLPHFRFERRKPLAACSASSSDRFLRHIVHGLAHSVSGLEVSQLAQDISGRNAG